MWEMLQYFLWKDKLSRQQWCWGGLGEGVQRKCYVTGERHSVCRSHSLSVPTLGGALEAQSLMCLVLMHHLLEETNILIFTTR